MAYIRAGAFPHVAAQAAGISVRTFYEWMERGEGRHPSRPSTPKLRRFVQQVRRAQAEVRVAQEIRVYAEDPKFWLRHLARSRPRDEGWSEPVPDDPEEDEEGGSWLDRQLRRVMQRTERAHQHAASCTDPACIARDHKEARP